MRPPDRGRRHRPRDHTRGRGVLLTPAEHARQRAALAHRLSRELGAAWLRVERTNIRGSWTAQIPQLLLLLGAAQRAAAATADAYVGAAVGSGPRSVIPEAFAFTASDGRPLAGLLAQPAIAALRAIGSGYSVAQAMSTGQLTAQLIGHTQVADAGRVADLTAAVANPAAKSWTRMLVGKTCARCLILAGRRYTWKADFNRHPRCFPAGVVSSGPGVRAAARRWYQGELVIVTTASGQELPATGNHPVLTDRGWLPINLLSEGDYVVRSTRSHGASAVAIPNEDHVPTEIQNLWRPNGMSDLLRMPTTTEDFHGDGGHGHVDVVLPDGPLGGRLQSAIHQPLEHDPLAIGLELACTLNAFGASHQEVVGAGYAATGFVGRGGLTGAFSGGHGSGSVQASGRPSANLNISFQKIPADGTTGDTVGARELEFALSGGVALSDLVTRQETRTVWDAPGAAYAAETAGAYAGRGLDLFGRLASQVELDRVIDVRRIEWSGHVYSLTSSEGWHSANNLIVSNCDCIAVPSREAPSAAAPVNPAEAFAAMSRTEQVRVFGRDGAQAIRDGADIAQVVNARSGMVRADGRLYTTVAAGRRRPRLMPEQIFKEAKGDRAEAVRLLSLHGYIR